jgi:succinate dehydrogenase/fumarate reductase flavoprotein subunit
MPTNPGARARAADDADLEVEVDLLVIGAGMAGMSAAGYAAANGARVLVLEKAAAIGGSAMLSGTTLWTAPTMDAFRELCPRGDEDLGRVLVEEFPAAQDWIRSTGVEFGGERAVVRVGRGRRFDLLAYLDRCRALVEKAGGWVLPQRRIVGLTSADGRITGAEAADDGGVARIRSAATLLATGGFQGDPELRARHVPGGADLLLRANPSSTGDGLRLARAAGAGQAGDMSTFYGHLIASPQATFEASGFHRLALQYSSEGVVLNLACERFLDESQGDHVAAQCLARQPGSRGLVVVDRSVLSSPSLGTSRELGQAAPVTRTAGDVFGDVIASGAHIATADDLESLGAQVTPWGFRGASLAGTVRRFNAEMADGSPPRRWNRIPLTDPPFWAIEVRPGITFTEGGIRVDGQARVLRPTGHEIPGMFAAGADVGGVFNGGYAGGLALGLVFGIKAARAVVGGPGGGRS